MLKGIYQFTYHLFITSASIARLREIFFRQVYSFNQLLQIKTKYIFHV